eukprot:s2392_g8.t1
MEALAPEDDPPVLPRTLDVAGATSSGDQVTPATPLEVETSPTSLPLPAFQEVFMQMQVLHLKLRDIHEAETSAIFQRARGDSVDSRMHGMPLYGSTSMSVSGSQALRSKNLWESRRQVESRNSRASNSGSPQNFSKAAGLPGCLEGAADQKSPEESGSSLGFAGRLVRRARKATDKLDDKIEADAWISMDTISKQRNQKDEPKVR